MCETQPAQYFKTQYGKNPKDANAIACLILVYIVCPDMSQYYGSLWYTLNELLHEIMVLFVLRKLIL